MPHRSFKGAYSRFLSASEGQLHFAAHSHHFWPDCTRDAVLRYWDDSAAGADRKWGKLFGEVFPRAQASIARLLNLSRGDTLCFAPNTHEFVTRIFSCLPSRSTIVTTDGEFHSFSRQAARLEEEGARVIRVAVEPFATFAERLAEAAKKHDPDLVFFSHVFFNSGFVNSDLGATVSSLPARSLVVVDGYHGFCAIPTDLKAIEDRAFYLAGGYKYAQAGEGACFLHVPAGSSLRPTNTGWFADFGHLESASQGPVQYTQGAQRFAGATFDPSGWYRFNAVMEWWQKDGITVETIHEHVRRLQRAFVQGIAHANLARIRPETLMSPPDFEQHGHFLTFKTAEAAQMAERLTHEGVLVDYRGDRLRFGFGMYHDLEDVDRLLVAVTRAEAVTSPR